MPKNSPYVFIHIFNAIERRASGLFFYCLTSFIVFLGVLLGDGFLGEAPTRGHIFDGGKGPSFVNWDGQWYKVVARDGYSYTPGDYCSVNFFPAYPLLARAVAEAVGIELDTALLLVSNLCLMATFILVGRYLDGRYGKDGVDSADYALLAMGLVPTSFFFRMAYSESLFLLMIAMILYGMHRRWPLFVLAVINGMATAVRPVGVALIPALAYHVWTRHPKPRMWMVWMGGLLPIALWGLAAYMAYLAFAFDDPLVFIKSHASWDRHMGDATSEKLGSLLTLRPVWCRFVPSSPAYWPKHDRHDMPLFSLYLADPFYFAATVGLVVTGTWRGWLTASETLMAAGLLGMPLVFKGYETDMLGFGRYAATVLPAYFVLGRILARAPSPISVGLLVISGALMMAYTALFARWYILI